MGFLNKIFGHRAETDDEKELREYEKSYTPDSGVTNTAHAEFVIDDTFSIYGRGTVVVGTVTAGTFNKGDKVVISSTSGSEIKSEILGIEQFRKMVSKVSEGEKAGILLKDVQKNQIRKNDIIKNVPRGTL